MLAQSISTQRLLLRRWQRSDEAPFIEMCADPNVMQFIGAGGIMSADQVKADIAKYEKSWVMNGYGQFAVELKQTGKFIGFVGLDAHTLMPEFASFTEIGWRFASDVWGRGYASEAAIVVMAFAQNACGLSNIVSVCQSKNIASERIMQKIGMSFECDGVSPGNGRSIKIYALKN